MPKHNYFILYKYRTVTNGVSDTGEKNTVIETVEKIVDLEQVRDLEEKIAITHSNPTKVMITNISLLNVVF